MKERGCSRRAKGMAKEKQRTWDMVKMKRQSDALQDTAALGLDTAQRISIPT